MKNIAILFSVFLFFNLPQLARGEDEGNADLNTNADLTEEAPPAEPTTWEQTKEERENAAHQLVSQEVDGGGSPYTYLTAESNGQNNDVVAPPPVVEAKMPPNTPSETEVSPPPPSNSAEMNGAGRNKASTEPNRDLTKKHFNGAPH